MGLLSMLYRAVGRYSCTAFAASPRFCVAVLIKSCIAGAWELPGQLQAWDLRFTQPIKLVTEVWVPARGHPAASPRQLSIL